MGARTEADLRAALAEFNLTQTMVSSTLTRPTEAELGPGWNRMEFSSSALGTFGLFWKGVAVADGMSLGARTETGLRATLAELGPRADAE